MPPLTMEEVEVGWPEFLCGGALEVEDCDVIPGAVPIDRCDEDLEKMGIPWKAISAYRAGRFVLVVDQTQERRHSILFWGGGLDLNRPRSKPTELRAPKLGRPPRRTEAVPPDTREFWEEEDFRREVRSYCEKAMGSEHPYIDLGALDRIVRSVIEKSAPQPATPPPVLRNYGVGCVDRVWIPVSKSFSTMREWAFVFNLPPQIKRREAVVRAFEFLVVSSGRKWQGHHLTSSRALALASLATGQEVGLRAKPWLVSEALKAEERTMLPHIKNLAFLRAGPLEAERRP